MTRQTLDVLAEALAITEVGCWFGPRPMQPADDAASHRHHAEAILAALADQGYGIGDLDAAWAEAVDALPKGWAIAMLWGTVTEDRWAASACPFPAKPGDPHKFAGGPTPAAALRALAATLRGADHAE